MWVCAKKAVNYIFKAVFQALFL